jgi:cystathionine gamma-synthase
MTTFRDIPFGQPVPDSPHAVLCSIPRLADVIGYEERRPEVVAAMRVGYPRFLINPLVAQAQRVAARELNVPGREVRLVQTKRLAAGMAQFVGEAASAPKSWRGVWEVDLPRDPEPIARAKAFHQHVGAAISSRQAEDILLTTGELTTRFGETPFAGDPVAKIQANLAEAYGVANPASILLTSSGMTAFFEVFQAVGEVQVHRSQRRRWLQIGWQYVDTTEVLKKFLGPHEQFHFWPDANDLAGLEKFFQQYGAELAGVVAEFPTNPLLEAVDLPSLHGLCQKYGAVLIVDPTLASPRVVDVLAHSDVVCNSLTKYAGNQGDFMGGAAVFNPASKWAAELRSLVAANLAPPYPRDLRRLATEIDGYAPLVEKATANATRLAQFLERHPAVKTVHWTGSSRTKKNFARLTRRPGLNGSVFSFVPRGDLAHFYDRIHVVKGPSFGVNFTLLCPFMYLAHYDLVSTAEGREKLAGLGLDPALVRVSVGPEPYEQIEAAFTEALK